MDSEKNISTQIMPSGSQQYHYKRIVGIIATIFVVGILAALAYAVFLSPNSHFFKSVLMSKEDQALHDQYNSTLLAQVETQFKAVQATTKPSKPLTTDQATKIQALFTPANSKVYTEAEMAALGKSFQAKADAKTKADQQAYENWKKQQAK